MDPPPTAVLVGLRARPGRGGGAWARAPSGTGRTGRRRPPPRPGARGGGSTAPGTGRRRARPGGRTPACGTRWGATPQTVSGRRHGPVDPRWGIGCTEPASPGRGQKGRPRWAWGTPPGPAPTVDARGVPQSHQERILPQHGPGTRPNPDPPPTAPVVRLRARPGRGGEAPHAPPEGAEGHPQQPEPPAPPRRAGPPAGPLHAAGQAGAAGAPGGQRSPSGPSQKRAAPTATTSSSASRGRSRARTRGRRMSGAVEGRPGTPAAPARRGAA